MWACKIKEGTSQYWARKWGEASSEQDQAKWGGEVGLGGHGEGEHHHHAGDVAAEGEAEDGGEDGLPNQVW